MTGIKAVGALSGLLTSSGILAADVLVPGVVPDGWGSWPATAMLGFIACMSLLVLTYTLKSVFAMVKASTTAQQNAAAALAQLSTQLADQSAAIMESFGKLTAETGGTNTELRVMTATLGAKPCMFSEAEQNKRIRQMQSIGG